MMRKSTIQYNKPNKHIKIELKTKSPGAIICDLSVTLSYFCATLLSHLKDKVKNGNNL